MPLRPVLQPFARGGLLVGSLLMLILVLVSVSSFNAFNTLINFIYLPLIGIYTWPRTDKIILSICIIFIFGLILDIVSSGPLGLWSLIFLINFAVFKPHMRLKSLVFKTAFFSWFSFLFFSSILLYFFVWFSIEIPPRLMPLIIQSIVATCLFPLVFGLRHLLKKIFIDQFLRDLV